MTSVIDLESGLLLQHKHELAEFNETEDFASGIINSSNDGVLAFDRQCRYTIWNPAMERMTGISKRAVLGKCAFEIFPFIKATGRDRFFLDALQGKSSISEELPYDVQETGQSGYTQGSFSPLLNEMGEIVGGIAIIRDLTERKLDHDRLQKLNNDLQRTLRFITDAGEMLSASVERSVAIANTVKLATLYFDGLCYFRLLKEDGKFDSQIGHEDESKAQLLQEIERKFPLNLDVPFGPLHAIKTRKAELVPQFDSPKYVAYARNEEHAELLKTLGIVSYICVPILLRDRAIGTISLLSTGRYYTETDLIVAKDLATRFSGIFKN